MKTINYKIGLSAEDWGKIDGVNVEASLKKFCEMLQAQLNHSLGNMADGYQATFDVSPVACASDENITWDGDEMKVWTEHTNTMGWIDREVKLVWGQMGWVVFDRIDGAMRTIYEIYDPTHPDKRALLYYEKEHAAKAYIRRAKNKDLSWYSRVEGQNAEHIIKAENLRVRPATTNGPKPLPWKRI